MARDSWRMESMWVDLNMGKQAVLLKDKRTPLLMRGWRGGGEVDEVGAGGERCQILLRSSGGRRVKWVKVC
jgi:hypothetical protein